MKALVELGYNKYVMPFEDAVVLLRTLENVEQLESEYVSGQGQVYYLRDKVGLPLEAALQCLTEDEYAVIKMRGAKPSKPEF